MVVRSRFLWIVFFILLQGSGTLLAQTEEAPAGSFLAPDTNRIYRNLTDALLVPDQVLKLDLSRHRLDSVPMEIFQLSNLRELNLSKNKLTFLPREISSLVKLEKLDLANNKLTTLPNEISSLKELKYLGLNRNVIDSLPPGIGGLKSLEVLELWDNELSDVPDEIAELKNLKVLELRGILFSDEQQARIDEIVVPGAKIHMSPSCHCSY